jgi:hypothetical protein
VAAGTGPWLTGVGGRRARGMASSRGHGVADPWARGRSNGWRTQNGLNRFKISNGLKLFKFFQTLIDPKFDFPELKKFEIKYGF